ncbi:unnamed protein product [Didymodactylos carnosus]|uniref:Uncharacterized protein n=1 Tax=Didymodactylos carnosus TaxID=1234261 RepID=A0A815DAF7_9BILA|nr:unnamed protein product [Didymodactylos carnosus]CAF1480433.1 unnamed protein product [Didymodactylos carnosus]CAF4108879.1 unnamed protein product [Didymodactylos carnosus]CAF4271037.1 unnamed protein product [Didymodactylos carnosus]
MDKIREYDEQHNQYTTIDSCEPTTILLIGRTRSGKTTIAEVLQDTLYIPPQPDLYSRTRSIVSYNIGKNLKVLDMPGFFDQQNYNNRSQQLSNNNIQSNIDYCLKKEKISLFAFVCSLASGVNAQDIQSMIAVKQLYPQLASRMALIITHCEELGVQHAKKQIDEFFRHKDVVKHQLKDYFRRGVLYMGCIRPESADANNKQALINEYKNVLGMRTDFIKNCIVYQHRSDNQIHENKHALHIGSWLDRGWRFYILFCLFILVFILVLLYGIPLLTKAATTQNNGTIAEESVDPHNTTKLHTLSTDQNQIQIKPENQQAQQQQLADSHNATQLSPLEDKTTNNQKYDETEQKEKLPNNVHTQAIIKTQQLLNVTKEIIAQNRKANEQLMQHFNQITEIITQNQKANEQLMQRFSDITETMVANHTANEQLKQCSHEET